MATSDVLQTSQSKILTSNLNFGWQHSPTFIDELANAPFTISSRFNPRLEICLGIPEQMLVGSISELVQPNISVLRYSALVRFAFRKMVEWRDHLEDLMRLGGERILGFKKLRPTFDPVLIALAPSYFLEELQLLMPRIGGWHIMLSRLKSRVILYRSEDSNSPWYLSGLDKAFFERRAIKRQKKLLYGRSGLASEDLLIGSVIQEVLQ